MGLITAALGGAGEGLEKGSNLAGGLYLKSTLEADRERLAEEAKSQREERNLRLASTLKREEEAAQPRIIPAGSTVQRQGQQDFQAPAAPEKALTQEQSDLLKAQAEELRARGKYYDRNNGKEPKPTIPKLVITAKDDQGNPTEWFDENTRATGTRMPGSPAVPPVSHWFSADEPGKAAVPSGIQWHDPYGRPIPSLELLYSDKGKAGEGAPGSPVASPQAPTARPPLSSFFGGAPQPKAAPAGSAIIPSATAPGAAPLTVTPFLTRQRGGFMFEAPPRSSAVARQLNGRTFPTPEAAQEAYDALVTSGG
jgi:hypothetical protein